MANTNVMGEFTELYKVTRILSPALYAAAATTPVWVDMRNAASVDFIVTVGATTGTVAIKAQRAADSSGTGAEDITGKTASYTATDDNKISIIALSQREATTAKPFVSIVVTPAAADTGLQAVAIVNPTGELPTSGTYLTNLRQNVTV